jgi:ferredoxin
MIIQNKILELHEEPEFQWDSTRTTYETDNECEPQIKIAMGNFPLDSDLWKGLRNPAVIGLHPAGLEQIWAYYANIRKERVDESGRQTVFQIPRSYDYAKKNYKRATIASVMLPFSEKLVQQYIQTIKDNPKTSSHRFARMYNDVNLMINKAIVRTSIELVDGDNAVVAMNDKTVEAISKEAIPMVQQGVSHGPSKGGNYPQKSIAALLGLGQFGVSRIVFRDEIENGAITRYVGPIRSIVIFDKTEPKMNGEDGIIYPSEEWRQFLFKLYDYTDSDPEINRYRFCSYISLNDAGCGKCVKICPSGAQKNSTPTSDGEYSSEVKQQTHRFYDEKIQFDYASCCDDRGQLANLYPEWSCARCVTICASEGLRRPTSISNYYEKKEELTKSH